MVPSFSDLGHHLAHRKERISEVVRGLGKSPRPASCSKQASRLTSDWVAQGLVWVKTNPPQQLRVDLAQSLPLVILHPPGCQSLGCHSTWGDEGEGQVRAFILMAVVFHTTLQCKTYYWSIRIKERCSVMLSSCIWAFVGMTGWKGRRQIDTLYFVREIPHSSGTF